MALGKGIPAGPRLAGDMVISISYAVEDIADVDKPKTLKFA